MVYYAGFSINAFTLDPDTQDFILTDNKIKIGKNTNIIIVDESMY